MKTFDYVIVGAGSAGSALASRLSEDGKHSVLVLEFGGSDRSIFIQMPAALSIPLNMKAYNWGYWSEPEPQLDNRRISCPRGKALGGSSSINGLVYVRGHAHDFDRWEAEGAQGWSYAKVLPYFRRAESFRGHPSEYRGADGPLVVIPGVRRNPLFDAFIEAGRQAGYNVSADLNGAEGEGFGGFDMTVKDGVRWSAANAYLRPAMKRPNLAVETHALATKILFEGRRAVGVAYEKGGRAETARAAREVILCGGAINSPQLLMLSGVGPAHHLAELGIPVVHHLAGVGQSLQDHYSAAIKLRSRMAVTLNDVVNSNFGKVKAGVQYALFRTGALTMGVSPTAAFIRTRPELASPDVKCSLSPFSADRPQDGLHKWSGFTMIAYQLRPDSRGEIRLKTAAPSDAPAMIPNYLSTELDQRTIVAGLKWCRQVLAHPALQHFIESEYLPGPAVQTDDELLDYARRNGGTVYHPTSTCKMGVDAMAVVDPQLRVHGLTGLRVVDASVMPTVASGNTNAPTIMIAEKAADMVRGTVALAA
jgi:choline dehydrogenase